MARKFEKFYRLVKKAGKTRVHGGPLGLYQNQLITAIEEAQRANLAKERDRECEKAKYPQKPSGPASRAIAAFHTEAAAGFLTYVFTKKFPPLSRMDAASREALINEADARCHKVTICYVCDGTREHYGSSLPCTACEKGRLRLKLVNCGECGGSGIGSAYSTSALGIGFCWYCMGKQKIPIDRFGRSHHNEKPVSIMTRGNEHSCFI